LNNKNMILPKPRT